LPWKDITQGLAGTGIGGRHSEIRCQHRRSGGLGLIRPKRDDPWVNGLIFSPNNASDNPPPRDKMQGHGWPTLLPGWPFCKDDERLLLRKTLTVFLPSPRRGSKYNCQAHSPQGAGTHPRPPKVDRATSSPVDFGDVIQIRRVGSEPAGICPCPQRGHNDASLPAYLKTGA